MDASLKNNVLSTYQIVTVKRLFAHFDIALTDEELAHTLQTPDTFYHNLLRIPIKNILNGIILDQCKDYQLYLQKVFIDYLIAMDSNKAPAEEAVEEVSLTKETLEEARADFIKHNENFTHLEISHQRVVGYSQENLLYYATEWKAELEKTAQSLVASLALPVENILLILKTLLLTMPLNVSITEKSVLFTLAEQKSERPFQKADRQILLESLQKLVDFTVEYEKKLTVFEDEAESLRKQLREYRQYFNQAVLKVLDTIKQMSEYRLDEVKNRKNQEDLYFDPKLGEAEESGEDNL